MSTGFDAPALGSQTDLRSYLGIPYEEINLSYVQIAEELSKTTGNAAVTVPTINDNGVYVTDSWVIAEYVGHILWSDDGVR